MSTTPPRRPRPPAPERASLPIVPILIGVIVLGFVIGAGLSLAGRHDDGPVAVVASAAPTPQATVARVTPAPSERPAPVETDAPADRASESPTDAPRDTPTPLATARPAIVARVRPRAAATARATPSDAASPDAQAPSESSTSTSTATAVPSATASPVATAVASTLPVESTVAPSPSADGDAAFAKLAAAVVREYVAAVARGDQESAYAALGASPGDRGASLTEAAVLDARTRIERVESHGAANGTALVSVALQTSSGPYEGQFTVKRSDSGAAIIVQHDIVKP